MQNLLNNDVMSRLKELEIKLDNISKHFDQLKTFVINEFVDNSPSITSEVGSIATIDISIGSKNGIICCY